MNSTSLYRHFAADGSLLYVGISLSWPARTKAHAGGSQWFEQVARVEIEQFDTREAALEAERIAIKTEKPKFNVVHNRAPKAKVTVRGERRKLRPGSGDPVFDVITGPHAIVGPALVYRDDKISVMVAHGKYGTEGDLIEVVLGSLAADAPDWAYELCDTVLVMHRGDEVTMRQARRIRAGIVRKLRKHLKIVEVFETDLALATAYSSRFPSAKSQQVYQEMLNEPRVYA